MLNHIFGLELLDPKVPPPESKHSQQQSHQRECGRSPMEAQQIYNEQRDEWLRPFAYFVAFK